MSPEDEKKHYAEILSKIEDLIWDVEVGTTNLNNAVRRAPETGGRIKGLGSAIWEIESAIRDMEKLYNEFQEDPE